jgi:hypothetical protein
VEYLRAHISWSCAWNEYVSYSEVFFLWSKGSSVKTVGVMSRGSNEQWE